MTSTQRTALITAAYDYMTDIAGDSYLRYKGGDSIDKYVQRGKHVYRLIRALERNDYLTVTKGNRHIEGQLMTLTRLYKRPTSALFTPLKTTEYKTRYINDGFSHVTLTQAEYDALATKDSKTIYIIVS